METIVIDGRYVISREALHDQLAARLDLPGYYGRNLDALYDLLTERSEPTRLVIAHREALARHLGDYARALLETLEEADRDNPALQVLCGEAEEPEDWQ